MLRMPSTKMKLFELYQKGCAELTAIMEESTASFEVYCLLEELLGWDRYGVMARKDFEVPADKTAHFLSLIERRKGGYPLQYLIGSWEFWGYDFSVGEGVLIPRADTETLCEAVMEAAAELSGLFPKPVIADLCSGSGCLPVVFSKEIKNAARVYAVELSEEALPYLKENAAKHSCENLTVLHQDVLTWEPEEKLHLISSNPPYLSHDEMKDLQTEVTYEPAMALETDENGLFFYRVLSQRYINYLAEGGVLAFEVGWTQAAAVKELMEKAGFINIKIIPDLCGIDRVVLGYKANNK